MADSERAPAIQPAEPAPGPQSPATPRPGSEWRETGNFLLKLALFVLLLRSFVFSPFSIPSESMLPRLLIGDFLFISKWNYGYSRYSLPWSAPLIPGRILGRDPARGDVVVFKAPPAGRDDWIKRVIGLPGDTVQVRGGQLILNGVAVPKQRVADFIVPVSPNFGCPAQFQEADARGGASCRFPRYRETLPGGRSYDVLDQGHLPAADDTGVYAVPAGHVFLMGDNRDNSLDSRFSPGEGGISLVPMTNLEGKAQVGFFSTDGSAEWVKPWTWFSAARWERIGEGF